VEVKRQGLATWLASQLEERGWSARRLAREMGVSHTNVNNVVNGLTRPDADFCIKVARALTESPEYVLRLGGHLSPHPRDDPDFEVIRSLWDKLPRWKKRDIVMQLRAVAEERERYDVQGTEKSAEDEEL